jgi:hypothetical protein
LKSCLLSPQHWAQEAGDNQTFMGSFAHCCTLHWGDGFVKTIPFNPATNTPILHTASASRTYRAYAATYEACEAAFYRRETVLQVPRLSVSREAAELDPSEFYAIEHVNIHNKMRDEVLAVDINADDKTVQTKNPTHVQDATKPATTDTDAIVRHGPLTFDPHPQACDNEDEDMPMAAADDQAELMRWHYRLGHLSFEKLKQLALNGEIPKKFAKVTPPKCAGCLFGAMTKSLSQPSRGRQSQSTKWYQPKPASSLS